MIKRVGLIGLWCLPAVAMAQQWESVGGRNATIELDRASVVSVDSGFQAWSRVTQPRQTLGPEEGFFYRRLLQLNEYRCNDRSYAPLQRMYFNDMGLLVKDERFPDADEVNRVVPGSAEDRLYRNVCRNFKSDKPKNTQLAAQSAEQNVKTSMRDKNALSATLDTPPASSAAQKTAPAKSPSPTRSAAPAQGGPAKPAAVAGKTPSGQTVVSTAAEKSRNGGGISGFLSRMLPVKSTRPTDSRDASKSTAVALAPSKPSAVIVGQSSAPVSVTVPPPKPAPKPVAESQKPASAAATKAPPKATAGPVVETSGRPTGALPWLYNPDSPKGPKNWASLASGNGLCSKGLSQSPIDIRDPIVAEMAPIRFDYKALPLKVIDTGTTIRVNADVGSSITWQGAQYDLLYYTFHNPSETQVEGKAYDMSIHLVHRSVQGKLTVLAVPVRIGAANPTLQRLWNNLPLEMGVELAPANVVLNPAGLLPVQKGYYVFVGSLSTPPCTEGVLWLVMKNPIEISAEQFADFTRLYRHNVRPIQSTRGRLIKSTRF